MIYVILGMHKSGTTLISQILHHSGINMGENLDVHLSYDRGNKYERETAVNLNKEILRINNGNQSSINLDPAGIQPTESQRTRIREVIRNCNEIHPHWGFKDPRTALTYPFWASELPEHKIITIFRSPAEIWPRFLYRRWYHSFKNPYSAWTLMRGWSRYNTKILSYLENTRMDFLVLSYREFITGDVEFNRLQEFIGRKLNDQRQKSLYRSRNESHRLLKMAAWLVYKQTGDRPEAIIKAFEALRQKQLAAYSPEVVSL
jgi:hypothetical protein